MSTIFPMQHTIPDSRDIPCTNRSPRSNVCVCVCVHGPIKVYVASKA